MASRKAVSGINPVVDFNRVNLALAKRQSMLASLMGVDFAAKRPHSPLAEDALDDLAADPELLGIGGKKQDDDEGSSQKLSSDNRLKLQLQLLSRNPDKRRIADHHSNKGRQGVSTADIISKGRATLAERPRNDEVGSDEDAGRSSLGKRKRERTKQAEEHVMVDEKAEEDKKKYPFSDIVKTDGAMTPAQNRTKTHMDNVPANNMSKKRKKKKNKKRRKDAKRGNPADQSRLDGDAAS